MKRSGQVLTVGELARDYDIHIDGTPPAPFSIAAHD